jgi:hypothetical protein
MQPVWATIEFPPQGSGVRIGLAAEMPAKPAPMMMTSVSVTAFALAKKVLVEAMMPVVKTRRLIFMMVTPKQERTVKLIDMR